MLQPLSAEEGIAEEDTEFLYGKEPMEIKEAIEEGEVEESVKAKGIPRPSRPSKREVAEHELTHIPYREWCVHCRRASGRAGPHVCRSPEEKEEIREQGITTYSFDYMYLTDTGRWLKDKEYEDVKDKGVYKSISKPILVCVDSKSGRVFAHRVDFKGVGDGWIVKRILEDLQECGYGGQKMITKCDQEASIVDLQNEIGKRRDGETVPVNSSVGDSRGNGRVENAVQRVQNQFRRVLDSLQAKSGFNLSMDHPLFDWLLEWSAGLINRYVKGTDGRSSYGRVRGYETRRDIAEFGKRILYIPLTGSHNLRGKMEMKEEFGLFLGLRMRTDEAIIGTNKGVVRAKYIRRLDESKCWDIDSLRRMQRRASGPVPGRPGDFIPVHVAEGVPRGIQTHDADETLLDNKDLPKYSGTECRPDVDMKRMTIRVPMLEKYGYTDGCPGCRDVKAGKKYYVHNDECRRTLREKMARDLEGQQRLLKEDQRQQKHLEKAIERVIEEQPEIAQAQKDHEMELERMEQKHGEWTIHTPMEASPAKPSITNGNEGMETTDARKRPASRTPGKSTASSPGKWFDATGGKRTDGTNTMAKVDRDVVQPRALDFDGGDAGGSGTALQDEPMDVQDLIRHWDAQAGNGDGGIGAVDVAEAYSPERVVTMARRMGMTTGSSMDITTCDTDGRPWDFSQAEMRRRARARLVKEDPVVLICSVMCTNFSTLMNLNWPRMSIQERERATYGTG